MVWSVTARWLPCVQLAGSLASLVGATGNFAIIMHTNAMPSVCFFLACISYEWSDMAQSRCQSVYLIHFSPNFSIQLQRIGRHYVCVSTEIVLSMPKRSAARLSIEWIRFWWVACRRMPKQWAFNISLSFCFGHGQENFPQPHNSKRLAALNDGDTSGDHCLTIWHTWKPSLQSTHRYVGPIWVSTSHVWQATWTMALISSTLSTDMSWNYNNIQLAINRWWWLCCLS